MSGITPKNCFLIKTRFVFLICFDNTFVPITVIKFFKNQNIMKKQSTCYLAIFLMLLSLFAGCEKGLMGST